MAARSKQQGADPLDGMMGDRVEDALPYLFPGVDPHAGLTIVGRVEGYRTADGEHGEFSVCQLAGAVISEPGTMHADGIGRLVRVGSAGVIVSRWIQNTLTPARFAPGSFVAVRYVGMQGRAKEIHVFTMDQGRARAAWERALEDADGEYQGSAKKSAGSDDLPF